MISKWVEERRVNQKLFDPDIFVLRDFNIPSLGSSTFKSLKNMEKKKHNAMTYEISDHLPLWVEFKINEQEPDQLIKQEF